MDRRQLLKALGTLPVASALPALAQGDWPTRNVTMIVPFPPGGQADLAARPVAAALEKIFGRGVIVENRGGAGGGVGNAAAARAEPDGYTLLMTLSSLAVLPEADRLFERKPAYEVAQLAPVARVLADPTLLAIPADAPWKTLKDFVEDAKKRPGAINYGSSGNYGTMHVPMEILAQNAGLKMTHVPFTGAAPAIVALLGGQIDAVSTGPATVLQHVKAGKLRVLAHWGNGRLEALPDVPSMKDAGYNAEYAQWSGLFVPSATPEPVVQRLRAAARAAGNDPKVKEVIGNAGSPVMFQDTPDFEKYVQSDVRRMGDVVRKIGKVE
jgi:tripartite-type tricarboxylate transporter receptor subunit TctC